MGYGPTHGPTDGPTDGRTDKASYRDAWTHLKTSYYRYSKLQVWFIVIMVAQYLSLSLYDDDDNDDDNDPNTNDVNNKI